MTDSPLDLMAAYAAAVNDHTEEIVQELEFIRNLTEASIAGANGSIGQDTIQQQAGAVADVCDTAMSTITEFRKTVTELQGVIQNAGG